MKTHIYCIDHQNEALVQTLVDQLDAQNTEVEIRRFPDGESYLRITEPCDGINAIVVCSMQQPDQKIIPLLFLVDTLKELGASTVGLVAPYLCYMRQDIRFQPGEAVTSRTFATLISQKFDWLVTVDPHLHRYDSLDEIYSIPSRVAPSAAAIASWIKNQVEKPLLVGPDSESDQWLSEISNQSGIPYFCLEKKRAGDRDVTVSGDDVAVWCDHNPVLIDDIISSGQTMLETIKYLKNSGLSAPLCIGIHALFGEHTYQLLLDVGATVVTCNTVNHQSNKIDINPAIIEAIKTMMNRQRSR